MLGYRIESQLKQVYLYTTNNTFIKHYDCIVDAANDLQFDPAVISYATDKRICKGYFFFSEEGLKTKDKIIQDYNQRMVEKRVVKLDTNLNIIKIYDSIAVASNENNLNREVIENAISRKTRGGDFY